MTEPVPGLTTRLTLGGDSSGNPAALPREPGEPGCCPGPAPSPAVPGSRFPEPVPGSRTVPGSGPGLVPVLPQVSLGSQRLTWWEWLKRLAGHWTGLYAAEMKKRQQKKVPPPERLSDHVRWALNSGWDRWLPGNCVRLRRYVLGPVEGTFQFLVGIPVDAVCTLGRNTFRRSVTGIPVLAFIIYILVAS